MGKTRSRRVQRKSVKDAPGKRAPVGASPGFIANSGSGETRLRLWYWDQNAATRLDLASLREALQIIQGKYGQHLWLQITGFPSREMLLELQQHFGISELVTEDMASGYQRPKADFYDSYSFIVSRLFSSNEYHELENRQLSFIMFEHVLISMEPPDCTLLAPVEERLRKYPAGFYPGGVSYLLYALLDTALDMCFPLLEERGDRLYNIESELLDRPHRRLLADILDLKKELSMIRKAIWPERDKLNELLRADNKFISDKTRFYLKDTYDHCTQLMDILENQREMASGLMDLYMSAINNRLSEVMKVLTVISSIFIPLTFLTGLYGMNFSRMGVNGEELPFNMPELYHPYGYLIFLAIALVVVVGQLIFFRRKGWL